MDYCNTTTGCKGENNVLSNTCMFCPIYLHRTFLRYWLKHTLLNTQLLNAPSSSWALASPQHSKLTASSSPSKKSHFFQAWCKKQNTNVISREEERELHSMDSYTESQSWFQWSPETARTPVTNYRHLQKIQDKKCQLQFLILVEQPRAFSFLLFPLLDQPWKSSLNGEADITSIIHSYSPATAAQTKQSLLGSSLGFSPSKGKNIFFVVNYAKEKNSCIKERDQGWQRQLQFFTCSDSELRTLAKAGQNQRYQKNWDEVEKYLLIVNYQAQQETGTAPVSFTTKLISDTRRQNSTSPSAAKLRAITD